MIRFFYLSSLFVFLLMLISCKGNGDKKQKVIDPMQAALPHGDTLPMDNLNEEDRIKLSKAIGRTADTIHIEQFINLIESNQKKLTAYAFWNLNCSECVEQNQFLQKLQNEVGDSKLDLKFINIDPLTDAAKVNTSIRTQGLFHDVYILSELNISDLPAKYQTVFSAQLPAILFVNESDDVFIHYDRKFDYDELFAVTQPLLM